MKKLIYTVALVVMGITASYAQKQKREVLNPEQRAEKYANNLQQKLDLTNDQKQKVKQLEIERAGKMAEWRKHDVDALKGQVDERKNYMKANREKLDAILTPEQRTKLNASRDEMKTRAKGKKGNRIRKGDKIELKVEKQN
ncbi:multiple ligand-binding protein 1 [Pedobacter namyangjuensis]|uniref:multiple ligand-binding protein 1 n=1 Tax=Pedobacter namyangjuensis TaxID=600626 RepID=UPI000DE48462|nr:multiple ligand-binding protein 1 [Pedobacter namyangjuensis]